MSPEVIQEWIRLGMLGLVLAAMVLGAREVWVFGWVHRRALADRERECNELRTDRNFWRDIALRALNVADPGDEK